MAAVMFELPSWRRLKTYLTLYPSGIIKVTWTSMIDGYFDIGHVSKACHLFNNMPDKDAIEWTAMVSGHAQNELFSEATYFFTEMRSHGVSPLHSTYCHSISRDVISWNSMIMGFADHGRANEIFDDMLESGTQPNSVTFLGILSACGHAGLVGREWEFFKAMSHENLKKLKISSWDCLSKETKPFGGPLLGVCGLGEKNAEIAKRAARRLLELDPLNAPAHVVLCNIYAARGEHIEEQKLRKEMGLKGVRKVPGCSWIHLIMWRSSFLSVRRYVKPTNKHRNDI
ncbi:hypothetical protein Tsubulata_021790 [Turnera subulata]|uniref:Pentatricopeptide repeat-containing protein n=1 Tax=Turnera subulata TaxID=218843 RepID=A0A9Q0FT55_9ROSI|nr:hypothetical protein Tsubulata_021790 [Turnera subulata]